MLMETGGFTAAERLAEWEAATLPRALECFRKMIIGHKMRNGIPTEEEPFYGSKLDDYLARNKDEKTALFLFYKTVLRTGEQQGFFEMFKAIILAKKGEVVENLATICGADLDIAQFFQINFERAEINAAQEKNNLARRRNQLGVRKLLRRLK